jgi:hypothetical protein
VLRAGIEAAREGIMGMRSLRLGRLLVGFVFAATIVACGGGGGGGPSASDPTSTVKDLMAAVTAGNYDKIADYACAAQKEQVTKQFDPSTLFGGEAGALGLTAADIKDTVKFSVSGFDAKEKSRDGTTAVVAMTGTMKLTIDKEKFKALMKKALEAAGQPTDDATLNMAMGLVDTIGGQEQDISSDLTLVNEDGKWLICE